MEECPCRHIQFNTEKQMEEVRGKKRCSESGKKRGFRYSGERLGKEKCRYWGVESVET